MNWISDELWDTCLLRYCMYWVVSYELCNHTIVRFFKLLWDPLWKPNKLNHFEMQQVKMILNTIE